MRLTNLTMYQRKYNNLLFFLFSVHNNFVIFFARFFLFSPFFGIFYG